ncbi:MAG TPA: hypothetical protein VF518_10530, partial [Polyangia bacterium]
FSANNQDALNVAPGNTSWGGNNRRERGGLGGRPLTSSTASRLFLGGGGGAGDGNNGFAGPGGAGGGLAFVIAGTIAGAGSISADGADGGQADSATSVSGDAPGGAGGGGTVVVHASALSAITVTANGGVGGRQININSNAEAEGPGGGGGGGFIALSGGTAASATANGGLGGTDTAGTGFTSAVSEFPSNGATAGNAGVTNASADVILYCTGTTGPDVQITGHPADPTKATTGAFTFTSSDVAASFECRLDSTTAAFVSCPASYTTGTLAEGSHTLQVRARDLSGNAGDFVGFTWTVDTTAPDTSFTTKPANPTSVAAGVFVFASSEPNSTFECRIGAAAFASCPVNYTVTPALTEGTYTLEVRATDAALNQDATPATWTWRVDLTPPDTSITIHPTDPSDTPFGAFTFLSTETGSTFQCKIDTGDYVTCPASYTTPYLADGEHTLTVRAQDAAGNLDATPATYTWEVHALGDGGTDAQVAEVGVEVGPEVGPEVAIDGPAPDVTVIFEDAAKLDTADTAGPVIVVDARADLAPDAVLPAERPADSGPDLANGAIADAGSDATDGGISDAGDAGGARDALVVADARVIDTSVASPEVFVAPSPDTAEATPKVDAAKPIVVDAAAVTGLKLMGSGFCSINPNHNTTPGLFTLFLVGALGLMIRRRRR